MHATNTFLVRENIDLTALLNSPNEQKLLLIERYSNILVSQIEKKKLFLNLASDLQNAYQAVLPDPQAEDYYQKVTAVKIIATRIREVGQQSIDVSQVKKDMEDLLDKSIQAGEYNISQPKRIKDLSALDANALHDFFLKLENKHLQVESLRSEVEQKITEMMQRNRYRARFMERLNELLHRYNSDNHDVDQMFDDLIGLAKSLNEEEQRAAKEKLSEEELAIFDLLLKEKLNPDEVEKIRSVTRTLLDKLKESKLVPEWREWESTRAGVKTTILNILYDALPDPAYSEQDCELKGVEVYNFVYEHYRDANHFVAY